jgi:hypothetical protein
MADEIYTLNYAGADYKINEKDVDKLAYWNGEPGVIELHLSEDHWLTIAVGPGIPFTLDRRPKPKGRQVTILR